MEEGRGKREVGRGKREKEGRKEVRKTSEQEGKGLLAICDFSCLLYAFFVFSNALCLLQSHREETIGRDSKAEGQRRSTKIDVIGALSANVVIL